MTEDCLRVGQAAPNFTAEAVVDQEFKKISLSDYKGKWVVLFFYPLDFTFVCPTEITAFSDRFSDFSSKNTEILGVSVDSVHCHLAWIQTPRNRGGIGDINYPLISDLKREIASSYNVLNDDGEADRGLFLINPEGVIMHSTVNKAPVGRIYVDGNIPVEEDARSIKERRNISANGFIEATILITPRGNIHNKPLLTFKGLPIYEKEEFKYDLQETIEKTIKAFSLNNRKQEEN